jgi:hypothetical protein
MQIRTRFSISADGYVTTPDSWPRRSRRPGRARQARALGAAVLPTRRRHAADAPALSTDAELVLEDAHMLPEGAVEIVYACS